MVKERKTKIFDVLDHMEIDKILGEENNRFRLHVRGVVEKFRPHVAELSETSDHNPLMVKLARELGPAGLNIKGNGCPGYSFTKCALVALELARVDASFATFYLVQSGLAMASIDGAGNEEQKRKWLPKMANYEKIGCFGLTEPTHGSDATNITTTAKPVDGGYLINGAKRWIGNGTFADVIVVWAKNLGSKQVEGFIIEAQDDNKQVCKGLTRNKINKHSLRGVQNADLEFRDIFIPEENRLNGAGSGFHASVGKVLELSRGIVAAVAAGVAVNSYELAANYCTSRIQFGKPVAAKQLVQERLMRQLAIAQGCVLTLLHLCHLGDAGTAQMKHHALAKAICTKWARECVSLGRENFGGNGIIFENLIMITFVDMEAVYTYEGTYDINMMLAGKLVTGLNAII